MIQIREYKEGDEKGIFSLWEKIFGNLIEKNDIFSINSKWWEWRVLNNPEGFPGIFVGVAESGEIVSHHMFEKFILCSKEKDERIYQGILSMADEKHRGIIFLQLINACAKKIKSEGALEYGFPNDSSLTLYERFGWKNAGSVPVLGRSLNPIFKIFDLKSKRYEVKKIERFDEDIDTFGESLKEKFMYFVKRDYKTLNWKYTTNPLKQYEKRLLVKDGKIDGYCVFRCGRFNNKKTGIILDILANDKIGFDSLLSEIIDYFSEKKMDFISCYMINNSFFYKSLLQRGFVPLPNFLLPKQNIFHILNSQKESILNIKNWHIGYGDWDCV